VSGLNQSMSATDEGATERRIGVALQAATSLGLTGLAAQLGSYAEMRVLAETEHDRADVAVVRCDRLTPPTVARLRRAPFHGRASVVLLVNQITEAEVFVALDCRVVEILAASAATAERLRRSVTSAADGGGRMPDGTVQELLLRFERLQHEIIPPPGGQAGLSRREVDVLRLMADGLSTAEIADEMSYSERTVKNVIHGFTQRFQLRNRSHAVAYAVRAGII
jgi:DNA-binding NarL/FixJ family response regulator